jgi:hypothetical protein
MANTPRNARPTADGVDPLVPVQNPKTLGQDPKPEAQNEAAEGASALTVNELSPNLTKEDDSKALPGNGATDETQLVTVKTKEPMLLMDPYSAKHIGAEPVEVPVTSFINDELAEGGRLERA